MTNLSVLQIKNYWFCQVFCLASVRLVFYRTRPADFGPIKPGPMLLWRNHMF